MMSMSYPGDWRQSRRAWGERGFRRLNEPMGGEGRDEGGDVRRSTTDDGEGGLDEVGGYPRGADQGDGVVLGTNVTGP